MIGLRATRFGIPAILGYAVIVSGEPIRNETKRNFYENDEETVPIPGTVIPASGQDTSVLGNKIIVEGSTIRSSKSFESAFKTARECTYNSYVSLRKFLNNGYSTYYDTEREITSTVGGLHEKTEDLLPNSIYVLIAGLSGNIFARQRGVFAKLTFPLVFGFASFKYFLPQTFSNTMNYVWNLEKKSLPELADKQEKMVSLAGNIAQKIGETTDSSKKAIESSVSSLRKSIANATGLTLDEEVTKK